MTVTLAELYLKQGLAGRAREILRKLAEAGDAVARDRLAHLGPPAAEEIALLEDLLERVRARRGGR
ncbi:MAG TPA: hypothetical protein VEQ15_06485 [Myxococcales bacterium]|jgi:hypothetical protein|nr:hypothetical protein [Myxococcales bacterium]